MKTYLIISVAIYGFSIISRIFNRVFKRNIEFVNKLSNSRNDKIRREIKTLIRVLVPLLRWLEVWAAYKTLTSTDAEMVKLIQKMSKHTSNPEDYLVKERDE